MDGVTTILVSGFTQRLGRMSGILRLRETLVELGFNADQRWRTYYLDWRADFEQIASDIAICSVIHGVRPLVNLAGYSYGGWGALRLAAELEARGISVPVLTLIDPVARAPWVPRPLPTPSSMLPRNWSRRLHVPGNVGLVHEFFQTTNRPQGHRLVLEPQTQRGSVTRLDLRHDQMDDAPPVHHCVCEAAAGLKKIATIYDREEA